MNPCTDALRSDALTNAWCRLNPEIYALIVSMNYSSQIDQSQGDTIRHAKGLKSDQIVHVNICLEK